MEEPKFEKVFTGAEEELLAKEFPLLRDPEKGKTLEAVVT
jgi:hypothetical protein